MIFFFLVSKFLITTGWHGHNPMRISEVIDLSVSGNYKCPDWVDNPIAVHGATGGLLGTTLITCGGWPFSNKCYKMKANIGYSRFPPKNYKNYNAQSTLIEKEYDDSNWIFTSKKIPFPLLALEL